MSQEPSARTTTKSGIIYQRTQQGWFETVGVWSVLFVAVFILLTFALPPNRLTSMSPSSGSCWPSSGGGCCSAPGRC
ncbi:MAG: hypothetical protein M5R40_02700 [Anaerolineae bacterium]|nr:hypothetical protein [Anaerolineae bacterium]